MTCIVGLAAKGRVIMGADSAGSDGARIAYRADAKLFATGAYVIGFTTSYRMGQLLQYSLTPPVLDTWDIDRFMATRFVNAVRGCLEAGGWLGKDEERREEGGTFLVGIRDHLYAIEGDFQIERVHDGYNAVGSGAHFALGSLHATQDLEEATLRERVEWALEAAAHHCPTVAEPFLLLEVPT